LALKALMWLLRIISSTLFLTTIILTVPLSFDVGGRTCGLAYSLSLASFYFFLSVARLSTPDRSRVRGSIIQLVRWMQPAIVTAIFLWSLGRFSLDAGNETGWVERTFSGKRAADTSVSQWLFGPDGLLESLTLGSWDKLLRWSTPVFQLCEGFCSLLVIQSAGQLTRWLVNRGERSDSWMIGLLVFSASVISSSVYFLYRVMQFPEISNVDASLIGAAIACSIVLCIWGIGSGRGNPVESSLLFAYIVLCIYQIFTDYRPSDSLKNETAAAQHTPDFPPFPPIIMASYTTLMYALSTLPSTLIVSFNFITAAFQTITPSVLISLGYRLFVLYASTRIIPAIHENGPRGLSIEPTLEDSNAANQFLAFLSWFSPSILVAVYTSLLMQHFATTMGGYSPGITGTIGAWWNGNGQPGMDGNLWKWVNLVGTMALYAFELWLGKEDDIDGGHWKVD
jgi:ICE2